MTGGDRKRFCCIVCARRTQPKERRHISSSLELVIQRQFSRTCSEQDIICNKCKHSCNKSISQNTPELMNRENGQDPSYVPHEPQPKRSTVFSPPSVTLKIKSTPRTHARCFICKRHGSRMVVVPPSTRVSAFIDYSIIINAGTRCCRTHIQNQKLRQHEIEDIPTFSSTYLNRSTILNLLKSMREICCRFNDRLDFKTINDAECFDLTGLQITDFNDVCQILEGKIRNTPVRSLHTTVGIFFLKLKSGMSNKLLSTLFGITRSSVRRAILSVRISLMQEFVPKHLGLAHISRDDIITNHTRPLAQELFGGDPDGMGDRQKLILVLDGTYIYIQKSNNFQFQRRSYSVHKGRPLVKPMVVVTTTGYFLSIVGPFFADSKNSDAKILNHMLLSNLENIKSYVHQEDVFIVDRGFRDSILLLEDLGIKAEMPTFMKKGQTQMTTEEANSNRMVTKIRWVVESANARIKRWKYLERILPNSQVPYVGDYVRIVCAISNKYFRPLSRDNTEEDIRVATHMKYMSTQVNRLQHHVEENHLERRSASWKTIPEVDLDQFPRLSEEQLRALTCGVYQLKLSPSYIQEHLNGNCDIHIHEDDKNLIRVRVQSRHTSAKTYLLWLQFSPTEITAWYCKCRAGGRVVGVCSHIAAIIWFLGYARHRYMPDKIGVKDWGDSILDASKVPEPVDLTDSSSDEE